MSLDDFSNGFDTLANSYAVSGTFGDTMPDVRFDEYEKSLYLTKFQEELVVSLYNGKNVDRESFEQTEELRRYLSTLIKNAELSPIQNTTGILGIDSNSKFFTLPEDLWFITYESVNISDSKCESHTSLDVYPVRQDEYHKIKKNPFRGANDRRALRLDLSEGNVEIVSKYNVATYYVRYLRKVKPIILVDLSDGLTIEGENTQQECELPESLHQRILEGAVLMALQSKGYKVNNENK